MALEPITRQEQILAGKDLQPITRMEKFLKEYGGGSNNDDFVFVKMIYDESAGQIKADRTYQDILTAWRYKKVVFLMYEGRVYELVDASDEVVFAKNEIYVAQNGNVYFSVSNYSIKEDGTISEGYTEVLVSGELLE